MKNVKALIFDLDGTLLYTLDDLTDSINYAMNKYGFGERTVAEVRSFVGNGLEKLMERALGCRPENFDAIYQDFKSHYAKNCNNKTKPYDGVIELLKAVKGKYKTAIVTNKNVVALENLRKIYFDGIIDVVVGQSDDLKPKPSPDGVLLALSLLGCEKEQAVYIGDSEVDAMTAKNSGLRLIACEWGFRDKEVLLQYGATVFAASPKEILGVLNE